MKKNKILVPSPAAHKFALHKQGPIVLNIVLTDLSHDDAEDNTAGLAQNIYYGKISDVMTFPAPVVDDSAGNGNLADLVTISSNIVMKSGKVMQKIYITLEEAELNGKLQGEIDGKSYMNGITFLHPGSKAAVLGFAQWSKNADLFFIVQEADGQRRILGHPAYPAKASDGDLTTGKKSADRKGNTFTFQSARKGPCPIFTGKIQLTGSGVGSGTVDANADGYQDLFYSGS